MLQISKSYTFKQLCQKSDNTLRSYIQSLAPQNIEIIENKVDSYDKITSEFCPVVDNMAYETHSEENILITELYQCIDCNITFTTKVDLEMHKLQHNFNKEIPEIETVVAEVANSFDCNVCDKSFRGVLVNKIVYVFVHILLFIKARWELNKHVKNHTENKPFSCDICGKDFLYKSHLLKHNQSHATPETSEESTKKPYSCYICHKDFVESKSLKRHMLVQHSISKYVAEKKHLCNICGKRYVIKLIKHFFNNFIELNQVFGRKVFNHSYAETHRRKTTLLRNLWQEFFCSSLFKKSYDDSQWFKTV